MNNAVTANWKIIDLTHAFDAQMPMWPGKLYFKHVQRTGIEKDGYITFDFSQAEGVGTHMDSPMHFKPGGRSISDLKCQEFITSACVIDVRKKVENNPDYQILAEDLLKWEKTFGTIPEHSSILGLTGWAAYWHDPARYLNQDKNGNMHFPGFSSKAAELCIERNISGVGIDTLSTDAGVNQEYSAHNIFLKNEKYQLENLTNLEQLPPSGAILIALPMKIQGGAEAPTRVVALVAK